MTQEVWAITTGDYSDYTVRACFPDEATAQAFKDAVIAVEPDRAIELEIGTFVLFPAGARPEWITEWQARWQGHLDTTDSVVINTWSNSGIRDFDYVQVPPARPAVRVFPPPSKRKPGEAVTVTASGINEEAVRHAVADRVAQLRAEQQGIAS